jgi:predicted amidohydrolase
VRLLLVQHSAGPDPQQARPRTAAALQAALAAQPRRPDLVVLPEATQADFGSGADLDRRSEPLDGPFVAMLAQVAVGAGTTVVAGMFEHRGAAEPPFNTLVAVGPDGSLLATYRKAHLYDAFGYRESDWVAAGPLVPVVLDVPGADDPLRVGLLTCYDLRFPEQARVLVDAGADLLVLPAAWLAGEQKPAHWRTLLRARAVENTVYVAATGKAGPQYCGLSALVDPLGLVLAEGPAQEDGWVAGEATPARVAAVRGLNPSLANRRWTVVPG